MKAKKKVQANPKGDPEVPMQMRNPYGSTFIQRVLLHYQVLPDGHPFNSSETALTPDDLKRLEEMSLLPEELKVKKIKERDNRWDRGIEEE